MSGFNSRGMSSFDCASFFKQLPCALSKRSQSQSSALLQLLHLLLSYSKRLFDLLCLFGSFFCSFTFFLSSYSSLLFFFSFFFTCFLCRPAHTEQGEKVDH